MRETTRWLLLLVLTFALGCPAGGGRGGSSSNDDDSADGPDDDDVGDDDDLGDDDDTWGPPGFELSWPAADGFSGAPETSTVEFGEVTTGDMAVVPLTLQNPGTGDLPICALSLAVLTFDDGELVGEMLVDSEPEIVLLSDSAFTLAAGATLEVDLRFTPLYGTPLDDDLHLVVRHSLNWDCDAQTGEGLYVPVTGDGFGNPQPDVYAKPDEVEFPTSLVGEVGAWEDVQVGDAGPGTLQVTSVTLDDDSHFDLDVGSVVGDLETGEFRPFSVRFSPTSAGQHSAIVSVWSNDPDENPLSIPLFGSADVEPSSKPPVAVCGADFAAATSDSVAFDGSSSYDSAGLTLSYAWILVSPTGSAAVLTGADTATPGLVLDVAGDYVGTLTVTNTNGQPSTCVQTIEVATGGVIQIQLSWTLPDDLDLHLLEANDGTGVQGMPRTDGDCYFSNCSNSAWTTGLDWGVASVAADNPVMDLDDIQGLGPEITSIQAAAVAPYDGDYQIMVHDYPGTVDEPAPNDATVQVWINGALAITFTFAMVGEDTDYYVARVHWPTGVVTACNGLAGCP